MEPDIVFIDIRKSPLTMGQVIEEVARLQKENPEYEIFMDGDAYAIVGRRRKNRWEEEGLQSDSTTHMIRTSGSHIGAS